MQGRTVYAVLGDWIGWLCAIIALLGIGWGYRTKKWFNKNNAASSIDEKNRLG